MPNRTISNTCCKVDSFADQSISDTEVESIIVLFIAASD